MSQACCGDGSLTLPSRGVITLTAHNFVSTFPRCGAGVSPAYGEDDMTTNVVNMDAMIPREDFYVTSTAPNLTSITRISVNGLAGGFLVPTLRKPDFQRETKDWSPAKVTTHLTLRAALLVKAPNPPHFFVMLLKIQFGAMFVMRWCIVSLCILTT